MQWLVGIDEAGYGPNLGPLVQVAAGTLVEDARECLWDKHRNVVCRALEPALGRIAIDDSKLIHVGPNKFDKLEQYLVRLFHRQWSIQDVVDPCVQTELCQEAWYLPAEFEQLWPANPRKFTSTNSEGSATAINSGELTIPFVRAAITGTVRFNALIERHGTKAAALAEGMKSLLRSAVEQLADHGVVFVIDKQGGRNHYAAFIADVFPDGWVRVLSEAGSCSRYEVDGTGRPIHLVFQPKAERECLPVAVASMIAKYLRERLMRQFNRYWQEMLPELAPTAGYPTDAKRYFAAISPLMPRLGLRPEQVWRNK